jgi:hypothetical protein
MRSSQQRWSEGVLSFLSAQCSQNGACSVPGGPVTMYGTCYAWLAMFYLGHNATHLRHAFINLCATTRDPVSGLYNGPELASYSPPLGVLHDKRHLQTHLTCSAVLPVAQQLGISLAPLTVAYNYCDLDFLRGWSNSIDWRNAWFEGNNILFVGQMLIYLRDVEGYSAAGEALRYWFSWLDHEVDKRTGLWGTNGFCSPMEAVYGGYHQLLVYYYENHPVPCTRGLVDTVLSLQHEDGGFNPHGNAGACEDVDSVDILVNCYKRCDYRRTDIRLALRHCLRHILATQNQDGGFSYSLDHPQSHMGVPGTEAAPNVSCTFPTWFRIHTLALIAEIIPNSPQLKGTFFQFNTALSMGWHKGPLGWKQTSRTALGWEQFLDEHIRAGHCIKYNNQLARRARSTIGRLLRKSGLR